MRPDPVPSVRRPPIPLGYSLALGLLTVLFAVRVAGQLVVAGADISFLPPFERWHSDLIAYPLLLPLQMVLLSVMVLILRDFVRGLASFIFTLGHFHAARAEAVSKGS